MSTRDSKGLQLLSEELRLQRKIIVCMEKYPRKLASGIEVLPYTVIFRRLEQFLVEIAFLSIHTLTCGNGPVNLVELAVLSVWSFVSGHKMATLLLAGRSHLRGRSFASHRFTSENTFSKVSGRSSYLFW